MSRLVREIVREAVTQGRPLRRELAIHLLVVGTALVVALVGRRWFDVSDSWAVAIGLIVLISVGFIFHLFRSAGSVYAKQDTKIEELARRAEAAEKNAERYGRARNVRQRIDGLYNNLDYFTYKAESSPGPSSVPWDSEAMGDGLRERFAPVIECYEENGAHALALEVREALGNFLPADRDDATRRAREICDVIKRQLPIIEHQILGAE